MKNMMLIFSAMLLLTACDNTSGLSDEDYARYKELGAPKLLYSCTIDPSRSWGHAKELGDCLNSSNSVEVQAQCIENIKKLDPIVNVNYVAGIGMGATYNKLLTDAKNECFGDLKVLESEK